MRILNVVLIIVEQYVGLLQQQIECIDYIKVYNKQKNNNNIKEKMKYKSKNKKLVTKESFKSKVEKKLNNIKLMKSRKTIDNSCEELMKTKSDLVDNKNNKQIKPQKSSKIIEMILVKDDITKTLNSFNILSENEYEEES